MQKLLSAFALIAIALQSANAQSGSTQEEPPTKDLTSLGLEDLMKIQVTTASKSSESVSKVPSAIFVITQEMIRRAGAQNIPDALRLAPGVMVSQVDASQWQVTIRGFNSEFADKILVLVDGRSVYTPDFSGVYWDELDMPMADIDRIEVIRGPGGSTWGENAVNGVVNVITKAAADTLGDRLTAQTGTLNPFVGTYEHGQQIAPDGFFRVFAKYSDNSAFNLRPEVLGPDQWDSAVAGFRVDIGKQINRFMFEGSAQSAHEGEQTDIPSLSTPYTTFKDNRYSIWNGNLVGRWDQDAINGASQHFQASISRSDRPVPEANLQRTTIDLDYQTKLASFARNQVTLGAGYRDSPDRLSPAETVTFAPEERTEQIGSGFIHDNWQFAQNVALLFGSKFERDNFDPVWEFEPNAQLLYTPTETQTWWASWSRAVRSPARADEDASINYAAEPGPGGIPILTHIVGNPDFHSEIISATEAGFRTQANKRLFVDVAAYHNEYTGLRSLQPVGQTVVTNPTTYVEADYMFSNELYGETDGVELASRLKPAQNWTLSTVCSYFTERFRVAAGSQDPLGNYGGDGRGGALRNQFQLRSEWTLPRQLELDTNLFYYDGSISDSAPAYWRLDLRLGWKPRKSATVSAGVQNLLQPYHVEAVDSTFTTVEKIPRSFYLEVKWSF